MGGLGDGRHMLRSFIEIARNEKDGLVPKKRCHFNANDVNPYALGRDTIIWMLVDELSKLEVETDECVLLLTTIFFI